MLNEGIRELGRKGLLARAISICAATGVSLFYLMRYVEMARLGFPAGIALFASNTILKALVIGGLGWGSAIFFFTALYFLLRPKNTF
jgi:hypothetical protein